MNAVVNRWMSRILIVCLSVSGFPLPASAGIVATDQISVATERDHIKSFLDRSDVRARIEELGADANAARARVDALTDDEANVLAARIDTLPAGGESVLGVLLVVFLVLLITDILGLTKVFSFTRSMR